MITHIVEVTDTTNPDYIKVDSYKTDHEVFEAIKPLAHTAYQMRDFLNNLEFINNDKMKVRWLTIQN